MVFFISITLLLIFPLVISSNQFMQKSKMYFPVPWLIFSLVGFYKVSALDNGLALTPPMGWLTWLRYGCTVNCDKHPDDCVSESLIKRMADVMVSDGYLAAGYQYLGIDDCWMEKQRAPDGQMVADRKRFPSGMKALADYIHSKGLKFAMYQDYGNATCAGYPGLMGHEKQDIATFVEWEVDYLKIDACGSTRLERFIGFPELGKMLNATGRPILYSCSWPAYEEVNSYVPDYTKISKYCNIWRNYYDIFDTWYHLGFTMDWFGDNQDRLAKFAGPGRWNDPDFLLVGNKGLTIDQAKVQMAVWSIMAAPLIMSADLTTINSESKAILLNKDIIAVNQDPMGKQGLRVWRMKDKDGKPQQEIWRRDLINDSFAVAFVNRANVSTITNYTFDQMGIPANAYTIQDFYKQENHREICADEHLTVQINSTGVQFYKFIPKEDSKHCDVINKINDVNDNDKQNKI